MIKKGFVLVILVMVLIVPSVAITKDLKIRPPASLKIVPTIIKVTIVDKDRLNHPPNCPLMSYWYDIPKDAYRTVWLQICSPNKNTCGGAYPTKNDGRFSFVPDDSLLNKDGYLKVYTQDKKYRGFSERFYVNGMLPQGQCY